MTKQASVVVAKVDEATKDDDRRGSEARVPSFNGELKSIKNPPLPVLIPAISWGDFTPSPENTQNTQKIKKSIKFTPKIVCVSPRTWSIELTLRHYVILHAF